MSRFVINPLALLVVLCAVTSSVKAQSPQEAQKPGFAVVELFTSQGCSSCPPADDFLRRLNQLANEEELAIIPLSFHVDYWNRLGWKDPFSKAEYSNRQRQYAAHWNSRRIYTPQMVVNGAKEFVGSNQNTGADIISSALDQRPRVAIKILNTQVSRGSLNVTYQVDGTNEGDRIHFALVQNPKVTQVRRGENSGRKLAQVNVVRAFKTVTAPAADSKDSQQVSLVVPAGVKPSEVRVVAYAQETDSWQIVGATMSQRDQASSPARN